MRKAFTLIEIMVVIALIGAMATIILPRLNVKKPNDRWSSVVQEINNLLSFARQEAIVNGKIHRLLFTAEKGVGDVVIVEVEKSDPRKPKATLFEPASSFYLPTRYEFPEGIAVRAVYAGKKNLLTEEGGKAYCYVIPDGLVQEISIWLSRQGEREESKITIKTSPFLGECSHVEGHQKPG